ncbi:hypothetical protein P280DRAFT_533675 [Massarina eburnea CBS 473.64]|uniref:J domain-containing protein n=1 Tax=Massarina eburnea CBS 473.64 TaxID=1395130 RepID=A0A6A6RMQ2_9PLEO|nr:hypothetical protein P280DRAFT_533675 [Massarina eburnea CBS 473.64]
MCRITIPRLRKKSRHPSLNTPNTVPTDPTPRPSNTAPSHHHPNINTTTTMQTSTIPAGVFLNPACATRTSLGTTTHFVDHYAVFGLDIWATSEEVKAKYRALRGEYFRTDPVKYRALQAAYTVLVDRDARLQYDSLYRGRVGLPLPPSTSTYASTSIPTSSGDPPIAGPSKLDTPTSSRQDTLSPEHNYNHTHRDPPVNTVRGMVKDLERNPPNATEMESIPVEPVDHASMRTRDPNWALKHPNPVFTPVYGRVPYWSFVPVATVYTRGKGKGRRMPGYRGGFAGMARPV